jgi:hypothetical protein
VEGLQRRGEVLPQQGSQLVGQLLTVPDRVLLGTGEHGDRLNQLGVGWQRPVVVCVHPQDVGQPRIARAYCRHRNAPPQSGRVTRRGQRNRYAADEAAAAEPHTALGNHLGMVAPD